MDTAHYMFSAISLFKKSRFKETSSYTESVIPKGMWNTMIFMMKEL